MQTFPLNRLTFRGCQGCDACKTRLDRCALEDELTPVLEAVRESEVLLLASPVYYGDVSSQLKAFIDRTYSFVVPDYRTSAKRHRFAGSKELVFVLTQSNPDERMFADIHARYGIFLGAMGFERRHLIRACGVLGAGAVNERPDCLTLAETTAETVCRAARSEGWL